MSEYNSTEGTRVFIGPTTAADDISAYEALPWVEIGGVENFPEFGDAATGFNFKLLAEGRVRKGKGSADAGQLSIVCAHNSRDEGQQDAVAAAASKFAFAFKVIIPDAPDSNDTDTVAYFHAFVMSFRINSGANDAPIRRTLALDIDTEPLFDWSQAVSGG